MKVFGRRPLILQHRMELGPYSKIVPATLQIGACSQAGNRHRSGSRHRARVWSSFDVAPEGNLGWTIPAISVASCTTLLYWGTLQRGVRESVVGRCWWQWKASRWLNHIEDLAHSSRCRLHDCYIASQPYNHSTSRRSATPCIRLRETHPYDSISRAHPHAHLSTSQHFTCWADKNAQHPQAKRISAPVTETNPSSTRITSATEYSPNTVEPEYAFYT